MSAASPHLGAVDLDDVLRAGAAADQAAHLAACVECRVRAARLAHAEGLPLPSESALARITASQAMIGTAVAAASLPTQDDGPPRPGELWRVGSDEALLVWVRKVLDDVVDVLPVVLDVDLADDQTLLLPASATPLDLDLAVVTSLRAHVHPDTFLARVHDLGKRTAADVAEVMNASRAGRPPEGVAVGPPVEDPDDQRIEFQKTVSDVLAELGPAAWARRQERARGESTADPELYRLVESELVLRHRKCTVHPSLPISAVLPGGSLLRAVARIGYADTSVLLAVLADWVSEPPDRLAAGCRLLIGQEPGSAAVAVCGAAPERLTVVVDVSAMRPAFESPSGRLAPPLSGMEPMHVVDALAKHLDRCDPAWEDVDGEITVTTTDLGAAARAAATAAVADIAAQGRRAATPAKKQAWGALPAGTAEAISTAVDRLVAGQDPAAVLDGLSRGSQ